MADAAPVVHIGENSPEQVALKLLEKIANIERKSLYFAKPNDLGEGRSVADRKWLLDTYAECLEAVTGVRTQGSIWEALGNSP